MRRSEKHSRPFAKALRKEMTNAEVILWAHLRKKGLDGHKFRRQHPIGRYIADFACVSAKLAVEIDGATHATERELEYDAERTRYMDNSGWRVLRVGNRDIYDNLDGVWLTIAHHLCSPVGGGAVSARRAVTEVASPLLDRPAPPPSSSALRPTLPPLAGEEN